MSSVKDKRTSKEYYYRPAVMPEKSFQDFIRLTPYDGVAEVRPGKHSEFKKPYAAGVKNYWDMEYRWDGYSPFYPPGYGIPDGVTPGITGIVTTPNGTTTTVNFNPVDGMPQMPFTSPIGSVSFPPNLQIGYTSQQMSTGETQEFTVVNGPEGIEYTWEVGSGGGSITGSGVYTAPGSNANCANNPEILLKYGGKVIASVKVAVNATSATNVVGIKAPAACSGPFLNGALWCYRCQTILNMYGCNGVVGTCNNVTTTDPSPGYTCCDGGAGNQCTNCDTCYPHTGVLSCPLLGSGVDIGTHDFRTGAQITAGCCPQQLL